MFIYRHVLIYMLTYIDMIMYVYVYRHVMYVDMHRHVMSIYVYI
jgi:hypothetical protein